MLKFVKIWVIFLSLGSLAVANINRISLGKENAPVTMYYFFSLACLHCATMHNNVFPELQKNYISQGLLRVVFIDMPAGGEAVLAAHAMLYKTNGIKQYESLIALYFKNQKSWYSGKDAVASVLSYAKLVGIPQSKLANFTVKNDKFVKELYTEAIGYSKALNIEGTPTTYFTSGSKLPTLKDVSLVGVASYAQVEAQIQKLLNK